MDLIIRPARPEDIPQLCDLLADLFSLEADFEADGVKQARGLSMLVSDPSGASLVLVAERKGAVVGMASVQTLVSTAQGGRVGLVEDVVVDRKYRGRGIGSLLLDRVFEWSRHRKLGRLQLLADRNNHPALGFYLGRGWRATDLISLRFLPG